MPASWDCPQCGLFNFASDSSCTRCGALPNQGPNQGPNVIQEASPKVNQPPPRPPVAAGIVLEDGYVLPPPPQIGGIWRDQSTLVMTKDASLPDYCVKCNAPANGFRLTRKLSWHHPALYLLILITWVLYLILAIVLRKQATVHLGLCDEHYQKRRNLLAAAWVVFGLGFIVMGAGFVSVFIDLNSSNYALAAVMLGVLAVLVSSVWLASVARVVNVKKMDDQFVWLSGLNKNFLARFPPL